MMKFLKMLIVAAMLVVLGACGTASDTSEDTAPTMNEMFLEVVHNDAPSTVGVEDSDLIGLAKAYCEGWDSGLTIEHFAIMAMESGLSAEVAGSILGAGTVAYCPEHTSKIG